MRLMRNGSIATFLLIAAHCTAAGLPRAADRAFQRYVTAVEQRLAAQHTSPSAYLATLDREPDSRIAMERRLRSSGPVIGSIDTGMPALDGALLHHWRAAAFVPRATAADMLALLRDYCRLPAHYAPEIVSSRVLVDNGRTALLAIRLRQRRVFPIVLDAEYQAEAKLTGADRGYSLSRSTHIWQIDAPGTPNERRRAPGQEDGFLWRLNSYWSFLRKPDGLFIECEAISLTRDIPRGLGWLIAPMVRDLPRQELQFTMDATRNALITRAAEEAHP